MCCNLAAFFSLAWSGILRSRATSECCNFSGFREGTCTVLHIQPAEEAASDAVDKCRCCFVQRQPVNTAHICFAAVTVTCCCRWECYNITTGVAVSLVNATSVTVQLQLNNSITCVAVYSAVLPPPQLALLSTFTSNFTTVGGNLTASGLNGSSCTEAPSQVRSWEGFLLQHES